MATIIYNPADSDLAERIQADLRQAIGDSDSAIVLLSSQAAADPDVQAAIVQAVERRQRIIPVLAQAVSLPRLIEHLEPVDFTAGYNFDVLAARLATAPGKLQMKVHTPETIAANRRTGFVVAVLAIIMFVAALYGIAVVGIQAPAGEYAAVEAEIIQTRNAYIDAVLPRSTEDAANFQPTVDAAATALRPHLAATASAVAGE